jgi:hypothetical protein
MKLGNIIAFLWFGMVFITIVIFLFKGIRNWENPYHTIESNDSVYGEVTKKFYNHAPADITINKEIRITFRNTENHEYSKPIINDFIKLGDSIYKKSTSDTIFVIRDYKKFVFILDSVIKGE